ncbi:hypothetical protein ACA910_012975 [Epithemia clementina (nom. ined.)]
MPGYRRRRVRFELDEDQQPVRKFYEVPCRSELEEEDLELLHFTKNDYKASRAEARSDSQDLERSGGGAPLQTAFGPKSKETQEQLNKWATAGHVCRGLERWSNRAHSEKRQLEQFAAVMAVLQAQHDMSVEKKDDVEAVRKVAAKATRNARHFARMMGKADSHAVALELKADEGLNLDDLPNNLWDMAALRLMRESRTTDEEKSVAESCRESTPATAAQNGSNGSHFTSLLIANSDDEIDEEPGYPEELDFMPKVDEAQEMTAEAQRKTKTRKLRLLKKLRRRMSFSSYGSTSLAKSAVRQ